MHSKVYAEKWKFNIVNESEKYKNFKERSQFIGSVGKKEIKEHFLSYSWYHFYTSIRGIIDPGRFDLMTFFRKEDGNHGFLEILNSNKKFTTLLNNKFFFIYIVLIPILLIQLIKIIFSISFAFDNRKKLNHLNFYLILFILYYIFITGPVNCSRLMMPFQGIFIVLASIKIYDLLNKRKPPTPFSPPKNVSH